MADVSNQIINFLRLHPAEFATYCVAGSIVLILLARPAILIKLVLFGGMVLTGLFIIAQQVNKLLATIQGMIVSSIQQAFDQLNRLMR